MNAKSKRPTRPMPPTGNPQTSNEHPEIRDDLSQAAQERGERIETGKAIARGGKTKGNVPGAEPAR